MIFLNLTRSLLVRKYGKKEYIPERGDIIWMDFDPQTGREIEKRRPALVLSHGYYNKKTGLCAVVPITSKIKGYTFEVQIEIAGIKGAILSDSIKNQDYKSRNVKFEARVNTELLEEVLTKISELIA